MALTIGRTVRRNMSATSGPERAIGLNSEVFWWRLLWFGWNWMRQKVQKAGHRADLVGGDAQVLRRGGEAAMTEEELNGPQVGA